MFCEIITPPMSTMPFSTISGAAMPSMPSDRLMSIGPGSQS